MKGVFVYMCPREESNLNYEIRNLVSYPLNDEDGYVLNFYTLPQKREKAKKCKAGFVERVVRLR